MTVLRCREHVNALWVLARLSVSDDDEAEQSVIDAIASTASAHPESTADPAALWLVLSGQVWYATEDSRNRRPLAGHLSRAQLESIALVGAGHSPRQAAMLTGVSVAQVHQDLRTGLRALRTILLDIEKRRSLPAGRL